MTAEYIHGILTIKIAIKGEQDATVKTVPVTFGKK